jgi:hypothetical protein
LARVPPRTLDEAATGSTTPLCWSSIPASRLQVGLRDPSEDPAAQRGAFQECDVRNAEGTQDLDGGVTKAGPVQHVAVFLNYLE